jgi:hypothetical protein
VVGRSIHVMCAHDSSAPLKPPHSCCGQAAPHATLNIHFTLRVEADGFGSPCEVSRATSRRSRLDLFSTTPRAAQIAQDKIFQLYVERVNPRALLNPRRRIAEAELNLAHPSILRPAAPPLAAGDGRRIELTMAPSGARAVVLVVAAIDRRAPPPAPAASRVRETG